MYIIFLQHVADVSSNLHVGHFDFEALLRSDGRVSKLWADMDKSAKYYLVQLCDLLRMLLLERFGGAYVDADVVFLSPLPDDLPGFIIEGTWLQMIGRGIFFY